MDVEGLIIAFVGKLERDGGDGGDDGVMVVTVEMVVMIVMVAMMIVMVVMVIVVWWSRFRMMIITVGSKAGQIKAIVGKLEEGGGHIVKPCTFPMSR